MKSNRKSTQTNFRLEDSVIARMDEICQLSGCTRVELVESLINAEYDRLNGNPQLRLLLEQLRGVAETLREVSPGNPGAQ